MIITLGGESFKWSVFEAAQNQSIRTNLVKAKIDKYQGDS